jgi:zinc transporter, ZIP family
VVLASAPSALACYASFDGAPPETTAFVQAFAGGALLTMLADTMMPEAFEYGGKQVGLLTTLGFALAFPITTLE